MTADPSPSRSVALVTCADYPRLDADDRPLAEALRERGLEPQPAIWNDPAVRWSDFGLVVLRSCWDYDRQPEAFRGWIRNLTALGTRVWNPPQVLAWNLDKRHLRELQGRGIEILPTHFVEAGSAEGLADGLDALGTDEAVVKPAISLSAHGTWRAQRGREDHAAAFRDQLRRTPLLVQRFAPEILEQGEWSLVFFEGEFSHACQKHPAPGDFRVQAELGGRLRLADPLPPWRATAERVLRAAPGPHLYARVDGVPVDGRLVLMEVELIDPQLYLTHAPGAAANLAARIAARLEALEERPAR